jgi:uncharacterized protein YndB with AHSA1/START domain
MIEPLVKTIEVPCSQKNAFEVFLDKMDSWWPMGKFTVSAMAGAPARAIRVEARVGGLIVEVGADGSEVVWGEIVTLERSSRLVLNFHIPRPGDVVTARPLLELDFEALGPSATRVTLRQSNFEALGDMGAAVRGGYGFGWTMIFEGGYRAACGG